MNTLLYGVREWFDKVTTLVPQCGQTNYKDAGRLDANDKSYGANHEVFALQPLEVTDASDHARRATSKAVRLLKDGEIDAGIRELHDAKQLAPKSAVAYCNLGCAYERSGQDGSALKMYREALRLSPQDPTGVLAVAILEHRSGQSEDAQRLLVNFLKEVDPAHIQALQQLAYLHQCRGNFSQAAGCFHRLIAIDHTNTEWPTMLQQCLEQVPLKDEHGNSVGQGYGQCGRQARAFSFSEPVAHGAIIDGVKEAESGRGGRGRLPEACRLREQGQVEAALRVYQSILQSDSRNAEALKGVVFCQSDLGDIAAAIEAAETLLPAIADEPEANLYMAELLLRQSAPRAEDAERLLKRVAAQGATGDMRFRMLCAQAEAALAKEESAQALSKGNEAVRLDSGSPAALLVIGKVRINIAEYESALRALSAVLEVCGSTDGRSVAQQRRLQALVHAHQARANERLRRYDTALQQVRCAIDLDDSVELGVAHVVKGMALHGTGRIKEAEMEFCNLLHRDPRNPEARLQLGYLQYTAGDPRAIKNLQDVMSMTGCAPSILGAARVYCAMAMDSTAGTADKVDRLLKEGLQQHKNLRHVWRELEDGVLDPQQAVQRFRSICDLDLNSSQARHLLQLLGR